MRTMIWMVFGLLGFNLLAAENLPRAETSVRLALPADVTPVVCNLGTVLTRRNSSDHERFIP